MRADLVEQPLDLAVAFGSVGSGKGWYLTPPADRNIRPGQSPDMPTPMGWSVRPGRAGRVGM